MQLFSRIPERFFSILSSGKKELYVEALFVVRQAFKTELVIRRDDLLSMLMDSLEEEFSGADFSEEEAEEEVRSELVTGTSGKARLLLKRLKDTGWIDTEYEVGSFEENITVPDYSIAVINLLYDLSTEQIGEYNSYVYATYAALANAKDNPDYTFQALKTAYTNTVRLIDELKSLFNSIRLYYRKIAGENDVNTLLREHFDEYKSKIFDLIYYPLKTIDSVPRFKHAILSVINVWLLDESVQGRILEQGLKSRVFTDEESGRREMFDMMNYVADTFDSIEDMLEEIDRKHNEYTNASVEHIRYLMNTDRSVKGKLVELLRHGADPGTAKMLEEGIGIYRHQFLDNRSMYDKVKRTARNMSAPLPVKEKKADSQMVSDFLQGIRRQYTDKKIDAWAKAMFGDKDSFSTEDVEIRNEKDFILFLMATLRAKERSAFFTAKFLEGNTSRQGASLPRVIFSKKKERGDSANDR